jgi:hypothetical protein
MSRWKFTKNELAEIEALDLKAFLVGYEIRVAEMLTQLSKIVENSCTHKLPLTQRSLYILRQLSINVDHLNLIYRRKSIEFMKQEQKEKENAD